MSPGYARGAEDKPSLLGSEVVLSMVIDGILGRAGSGRLLLRSNTYSRSEYHLQYPGSGT